MRVKPQTWSTEYRTGSTRRRRSTKRLSFGGQFLLEDHTAYLALRTTLRTGDFKLRLAALRRLAPVFCGYGKDRYQWLVSVHLADMAKMTDNDFKALSYLFSTSLGGNAFTRVGLDEKQEVANRLNKGAVMKITRSYVRKMAAIVEAREKAVSAVQQEYFVTGKSRDPVAELVWKRRNAVLAARPTLRDGNAFQAAGKTILMALDGREATIAEAAEMLRVPELCAETFVDVVKSCELGDKSANGPTKKRMKFFPATRNSSTATRNERGATAAQRNLKNSREAAKELHKALRKLVYDYGRASKEDMESSCREVDPHGARWTGGHHRGSGGDVAGTGALR